MMGSTATLSSVYCGGRQEQWGFGYLYVALDWSVSLTKTTTNFCHSSSHPSKFSNPRDEPFRRLQSGKAWDNGILKSAADHDCAGVPPRPDGDRVCRHLCPSPPGFLSEEETPPTPARRRRWRAPSKFRCAVPIKVIQSFRERGRMLSFNLPTAAPARDTSPNTRTARCVFQRSC